MKDKKKDELNYLDMGFSILESKIDENGRVTQTIKLHNKLNYLDVDTKFSILKSKTDHAA